jgi:hypothetical protein
MLVWPLTIRAWGDHQLGHDLGSWVAGYPISGQYWYKAYVIEEVGADIYYDPKDMAKSEIPARYRECLVYGRTHCPQKIKTGWRALEGEVG